MRHRSPTNATPWRDDDLRWRYQNLYPFDEAYRWLCEAIPAKQHDKFYSPWFGSAWPEKYRLLDRHLQVHHIHQAKTGVGKWDLWSNLITVSKPTHDWLHANPIDGRVICLYAKFRKAAFNPEDFVLDELSQASGKLYPSVIETYDVAGRVREMRDELVAATAGRGAA